MTFSKPQSFNDTEQQACQISCLVHVAHHFHQLIEYNSKGVQNS